MGSNYRKVLKNKYRYFSIPKTFFRLTLKKLPYFNVPIYIISMSNNKNITIQLSDQVALEMVFVEGGAFMMGSADSEATFDREKPQHNVQLPSFFIGKYPVTQQQWEAIMGTNPSRFNGPKRPVEKVSWNDIISEFLPAIRDRTGNEFRLPTEAEWEFAARGGIRCMGYIYSGSDQLDQVGWYTENSGNETHSGGQLMANELGLFDMSGNVWEWCEDDWHKNYDHAPKDGKAWVDNPRASERVLRGGCYWSDAVSCRSTGRYRYAPSGRGGGIGFRLALFLQSVG